MFRIVVPAIVRKRLRVKPENLTKFITEHRELINPVIPVSKSKPV